MLLFDEYANYEGYEGGEFKAWAELGVPFAYLAFHGPGSGYPTTFGFQSVAVVCT